MRKSGSVECNDQRHHRRGPDATPLDDGIDESLCVQGEVVTARLMAPRLNRHQSIIKMRVGVWAFLCRERRYNRNGVENELSRLVDAFPSERFQGWSGPRILFVTARGDEKLRPLVLAQSAVESLFKPFSEDRLLDAITLAHRAA